MPHPQLGAQRRLHKDTVWLGSGGAHCIVCLDLNLSWVARSSGCGVEPELGFVGALGQEQGQSEAGERGEVLWGSVPGGFTALSSLCPPPKPLQHHHGEA